ncbi:MAG: hypothetical protein ACLFWL_10765 [Candidatus Brocadiia bacterium]
MKTGDFRKCWVSFVVMAFLALVFSPSMFASPPDTALESEPPLPRAATWLRAYGPQWQIRKMEEGHKLFFMFSFNKRKKEPNDDWENTYRPIFEKLQYYAELSSGWYHLPTSMDPDKAEPKSDGWKYRTKFPKNAKFPVWAQAQVMGEKGSRRWLLFTYAPLDARKDVTITIPGFGPVTVDVPVKGKYVIVDENEGGITKTIDILEIE